MGNRARDAVAGRRGPPAQQSRAQPQIGNQRINGNQNQHRNDKTSKPNPASKQNQTIKKEPQDVKTSDNEKADTQPDAKSEEIEMIVETAIVKKEENAENESIPEPIIETETVPKVEPTEEPVTETTPTPAAATITPVLVKKPDDNQPSGKKSEARHAESRYAAVPISHMFCHVCTKHMWDGFSFENHLRGRAHQLMMEKLDQSYKLRVDFMRHELKVAEEQRELSFHNSKRRGKKVPVDLNVREYCTMCDLNFYGTLSAHRKGDKHQQLKTFLHPRCIPCAKEFPSRIEYDEHCLTPAHMMSVAQIEEQKKKKNKLAKGESEVRTGEEEEKDVGIDQKSNEVDEELPENTEYLLDINDDMSNEKYKIPSFRYCRQNQVALGASLVKKVEGYHCDKCRRFMLTEEDMHAHLRTSTHYRNFVAEVKAQTAPAVPENNVEKEVEGVEEDSSKQEEESQQNEDDGNDAKRQKIEDPTENESTQCITEPSNITSTEDASEAAKKVDGNEIYDPLEADADSEEDENKVNANKNDEVAKDDTKTEQSMEVWGDGDNDNEPEVGNLLDDDDDDDEDEQMETQSQTSQLQTPTDTCQLQTPTATCQLQTPTATGQLQTPTATSQLQTPPATSQLQTPPATSQLQTPAATSQLQTPPATSQLQTPTATSQLQTPTATSQLQTPTATSQPQLQNQCQFQQQQQLQAPQTIDNNQMMKKNNSPIPSNNTNSPLVKSPRGRGFRGRGHQRARRSRR